MKILFVGGSYSRNSGGVYNSAKSLGLALSYFNTLDVEFLMHGDEFSAVDKLSYHPLKLHEYTLSFLKSAGFSLDIFDEFAKIKPDIVHFQGMWLFNSYANSKYCNLNNIPYIIAPHGMLDPWQLKQSVIKKTIALSLYEKKHLNNARCIHALCYDEYKSIRSFGLKQPVAIIPNGITIPDEKLFLTNEFLPKRDKKTLLFLSRMHTKKGIENLLQAWKLTNPHSHNWNLVIVGDTKDDLYKRKLFNLALNLKIDSSVKFEGGKYGFEKISYFLSADAFILPSYSEGLPMAILEAWSYKLPVLMTPQCNLPEGFQANAAIEIKANIDDIAFVINRLIMKNDDELKLIGENGYKLVEDKFSWKKVAYDTHIMYNWLLNDFDKPDFVYNN